MPVPSGAVPIKITDGWSFADSDELGVKSVVDRDEESSSDFAHVGQQRPEMRLVQVGVQERGERCPGVRWCRLCTKTGLSNSAKEFFAWSCCV